MSNRTHFFNTTSEHSSSLDKFEDAALAQDERILNFFTCYPSDKFTASDVWRRCGFESEGVPITSVRRALSNLKDCMRIRKTDEKKTGLFGRPENYFVFETKLPKTLKEIFGKVEFEIPSGNRDQLLKAMKSLTPKPKELFKLF